MNLNAVSILSIQITLVFCVLQASSMFDVPSTLCGLFRMLGTPTCNCFLEACMYQWNLDIYQIKLTCHHVIWEKVVAPVSQTVHSCCGLTSTDQLKVQLPIIRMLRPGCAIAEMPSLASDSLDCKRFEMIVSLICCPLRSVPIMCQV